MRKRPQPGREDTIPGHSARPALPPLEGNLDPAAAPLAIGRILALQRLAGNSATTRLIEVQRLALSDEQWKHISEGEVETTDSHGNKLKKPKLTGYHWTGVAKAVAQKDGTKSKGPDALGVYEEGVRSKVEYGTGKDKGIVTKDKASTFWPDGWSAAEIKDAIAKAGTPKNNVSTVALTATKAEARGMSIFSNAASRFPVLGEVAEEEPTGRGGRRGRGR